MMETGESRSGRLALVWLVMLCLGAPALAFDADCVQLKDESGNVGIAKELIDPARGVVYLAGGPRPISDAAWPSYTPPAGLQKNTTRHLLFDDTCHLRSFSAPVDCRGTECLTVRTIDGFTWVELARVAGRSCLPDPDGCTPVQGKPGNLRATRLVKCHLMEFRDEIYELADPTGNRFVMHATGAPQPNLAVPLPPGWTLAKRRLDEPLVIEPHTRTGCEYTLLRDALDQSYHQYVFDGSPLSIAASASGDARSARASSPPDIVLIVADDLGYNDISLNGNPLVRTPHIDSLARDGARFVAGYAAHSTCSPSRAALMTGRFPQRFGFESVRTPDTFLKSFDGTYPTEDVVEFREADDWGSETESGLPTTEITIAELLEARGYRSAMIGKWHLGSDRSLWPEAHGFDEFTGFPGGAAMFSPPDDDWSVAARLPWSGIDSYLWDHLPFMIIENGRRKEPEGYVTDVLAERAVEFIGREDERPFFLYLAFNAPHNPLDAPKDVYDRLDHIADHKTRVYYAMIESMDAAIGRVLAALEASGRARNTIVIFTSDNGGAWYTHIPLHNHPYRGWKATFFEGGINVPLLVRWPGVIPPGRVVAGPASGVDVLPTVAAAVGVPLPDDRVIDGRNLLPAITGNADLSDRTLYWSQGGYRVIRQGHWKLQVQEQPAQVWLFDLAADPTEQVNLAAALPDKVAELQAALRSLGDEMVEPMWRPPYRLRIRVGPPVEPPAAQTEWIWNG
ncbi:MAG TPA: sulfatase [Pseudomonadales bacterium]